MKLALQHGVKIASLVLTCAGVASVGHALSLHEALQQTLAHNPQIFAAKETMVQAQEDVATARASFLPTLQATAGVAHNKQSYKNAADTSATPKNYGLTASQTLFAGFSNYNTLQENKALLGAAEATFHATGQNILQTVVQAYTDTLKNKEIFNLQQNQSQVLQKQLQALNIRFKAGDVTKTDVKQAEAALAASQAAEYEAQASLNAARQSLKMLLNDIPANLQWPAVLASLVQAAVPADVTQEQVFPVAAKHPQVVAALARLNGAKHAVAAARGEHLPTLSVAASITQNKDTNTIAGASDYTDKSVNLSLTLPLFEGGKINSGVRTAVSQKMAALQNYEQATREVSKELHDALGNLYAKQQTLQAYQLAVEANQMALRGVELEEQAGGRTVLDVLTARQELLTAQNNSITAKAELVVAYYRLLAAQGLLLDASSAPTEPVEVILPPVAQITAPQPASGEQLHDEEKEEQRDPDELPSNDDTPFLPPQPKNKDNSKGEIDDENNPQNDDPSTPRPVEPVLGTEFI